SFCLTCSSVTGLLPSINTGPLSRSGAAITKAAAAASNTPPAIDHMSARFIALYSLHNDIEPRRGNPVKHAAFKAGLSADLLNCDKSGDAAALGLGTNAMRRSTPFIKEGSLSLRRLQVYPTCALL